MAGTDASSDLDDHWVARVAVDRDGRVMGEWPRRCDGARCAEARGRSDVALPRQVAGRVMDTSLKSAFGRRGHGFGVIARPATEKDRQLRTRRILIDWTDLRWRERKTRSRIQFAAQATRSSGPGFGATCFCCAQPSQTTALVRPGNLVSGSTLFGDGAPEVP